MRLGHAAHSCGQAGAYTWCVTLGAHKAIKMNTETIYQTLAGGMRLPYGGHLNFARILTPQDAAKVAVTFEKEVRDSVRGQWIVCGDVSSKMFARLRDAMPQDVATRLSAFHSPEGVAYAVVTHQIGGFQHRLIVCLYDPPVRELLSAVCAGESVGFFLGNQGEHHAVFVENPHQPIAFAPLLSMAKVKTEDAQDRALRELPNLLATLADVEKIPSVFREPVTDVCRSLLLPERLQANLAALLNRISKA